MPRKRTERELKESCLAREVIGGCCQYPDCGCFDASDYYEKNPEALTPEQQPSDISYAEVSTDDIKRMNEYAKDAAYTPEKRREE